jgi:RNA ligase
MEFTEFKKIPRLFRDCVVSEKIDGTNGQIVIELYDEVQGEPPLVCVEKDAVTYNVWAGSRNRWIYTGKSKDNHGFAQWVMTWAIDLVEVLGVGRHFGEWWGQGIQRGYGLTEKRFSLFNTDKWAPVLRQRNMQELPIPQGLGVVPVLYEGKFLMREVEDQLLYLRIFGSQAAPGYMDPEGVVVYHVAGGNYFKVTIKDDEKPKGQQ